MAHFLKRLGSSLLKQLENIIVLLAHRDSIVSQKSLDVLYRLIDGRPCFKIRNIPSIINLLKAKCEMESNITGYFSYVKLWIALEPKSIPQLYQLFRLILHQLADNQGSEMEDIFRDGIIIPLMSYVNEDNVKCRRHQLLQCCTETLQLASKHNQSVRYSLTQPFDLLLAFLDATSSHPRLLHTVLALFAQTKEYTSDMDLLWEKAVHLIKQNHQIVKSCYAILSRLLNLDQRFATKIAQVWIQGLRLGQFTDLIMEHIAAFRAYANSTVIELVFTQLNHEKAFIRASSVTCLQFISLDHHEESELVLLFSNKLLSQLLSDPDPQVRVAAVCATKYIFPKCGNMELNEKLQCLSQDSDSDTRAEMLRSLKVVATCDEQHLQIALSLLDDTSRLVRLEAIGFLEFIARKTERNFNLNFEVLRSRCQPEELYSEAIGMYENMLYESEARNEGNNVLYCYDC